MKKVTIHYSTRSYDTATITVDDDVDPDDLDEEEVQQLLEEQHEDLAFGEDNEFQMESAEEDPTS